MNYTKYIISFLIDYFSHWQNALFWLMVLTFSLYENIKANHQKKRKMKQWLKKHNINKNNSNEPENYIDAIWEELKKH